MTAVAQTKPQRPWWLTLIVGIAAIIIGGILLFGSLTQQLRTYLLLVQLLGIWWLVDGIFDIVGLFVDRTAWGWKLFMGIVSILAGGWILIYPAYAAVTLPRIFVLILGIWGLMKGLLLLFLAFKGGGWGAGILAVITIVFGGILIANYDTAGWGLSLIWVAALFGFVGGFFMVFMAFKQRKA
jgi:uncharacterized membrane protein HdeD (DUF308 family)